ncbi:MAG TPA: ureidoglycolate lyase [Rhizobiaceae bacterium]|nr:ureidoglycolate lyase [Rhizobiaceae bacterium]
MRIEVLDVELLERLAFAPFGDVIATDGAERRLINNGTTERFHDLARIDVASARGSALINIFRGQPFQPPIDIVMMERHPLGSQAFYPVNGWPFLIVVAEDRGGAPGRPRAFLSQGYAGVNYGRNVWHHPLISLVAASDFIVVDRGGPGNNLEEHFYSGVAYRVDAAGLAR